MAFTTLHKIAFVLIFSILFTASVSNISHAADNTPPVSTLTPNPTSPNGENGWYVTYPNININAEDNDSGVSSINWRINGGNWQTQTFSSGLNLVQNHSFEQGYIHNWDFVGAFPSVGIKSSFRKKSGNFSAVIITLGRGHSYWRTTAPIPATSLKTYTYSFYATSFTSWLDNGFYEVVLVDQGQETPIVEESIVISEEELDLKLSFKKYSGAFTLGDVSPSAYLYIKIGLNDIGHMGIDDVYLSSSGDDSGVNFTLNQEGENLIQYYSRDAANNTESTKSVTVKVDTIAPFFSGFDVFDQESLQKFASRMNVTDATSKLVANPAIFNYAVDGYTAGYYQNYSSCSGEFHANDYLDLNTSYSTGATSGTVSTPQIDYCDTNWINCKELNFYVKDLAGNIGSNSICINGPYITSKYGNIYARDSIYQMGLGNEPNVWGVAVSGSFINDISFESNSYLRYYEAPYLNTVYTKYIELLQDEAQTINTSDSLNLSDSGVYLVDGDYTIDEELDFEDVDQIIFVDGDLVIAENILADPAAKIFFIVRGDVNVANAVVNVSANIISSNQIFTADSADLAEKITFNGVLIGQDLVFNRNTDRTLGASEVINFPIHILLEETALHLNNIYWSEVTD